MAPTTHGFSRTFTVGAASLTIDILDVFGRRGVQSLRLTNKHATQGVHVSLMGGAIAAVTAPADDLLYIGPGKSVKIGWRDTITAFAAGAGTDLEVAKDDLVWDS